MGEVSLDLLIEQVSPHMERGANPEFVKDCARRAVIQFCQDTDFIATSQSVSKNDPTDASSASYNSNGRYYYTVTHANYNFGNLIRCWQGKVRYDNLLPPTYIQGIESQEDMTFLTTGFDVPATDPIVFTFSLTPRLSLTTIPRDLFEKYQQGLIAKACMLAASFARKHDWTGEYQMQYMRARSERERAIKTPPIRSTFGEPIYGTEAERFWRDA